MSASGSVPTKSLLCSALAVKILLDSFAGDADRLMRFEREARTLAGLNHPHIAHVYGLESSARVRAIVMELVEGEDLAQRIARGPKLLSGTTPAVQRLLGPPAISPDGRWIAVAAIGPSGNFAIWLRPMDGQSFRPIASTDQGSPQ